MARDAVADPVQQRLRGAADPREHLVGFYETDAFLVESVVEFLATGLDAGDAAVVVATTAHGRQLEEALTRRGTALPDAGEGDQLIVLDAAELVAALMVEDTPDPERFQALLGPVVERATQGGRRVRVFGEMAALLWEDGRVLAACALENLWNELAADRAFGMLCMYPTSAVNSEDRTLAFLTVCEQHAGVIPSEDYSTLPSLDDRLRRVALLQQEATAAHHDRLALRRKQEELEEALERLRELDRVRNEVLSMVVHDVRNPAAVVTGLLTLLQDAENGLDDPHARWALTRAVANADRIGRLADDVLTMTALESARFSVELRPVDLVGIVERAAAEVGGATGRHIGVVPGGDLPAALGDEDRQAQILSNLLTNAVRFSPPTATVDVEVQARGDRLVVSVRDEGPGIDEQDLGRLFRPFSRLSASDEQGDRGTGLGLYIAKQLVERQGGEIWVDSVTGQGSTFAYTVPAATP